MKSQFDFGTIIGLAAGLFCIFVSMIWPEVDRGDIVLSSGDSWRFEQLIWFYQPQSVFIVLGGVISATLVNYPIKAVINMGNVFKNVVLSEKFDFTGTIDKIVVLAEKSRKDGLLSLEAGLKDIESVFLRNGIELAINERDSNRLRTFLTMDLNNISTEQSEYDGYLVNRDDGLHRIEGYHISDSSLGIILVHGRYPDNWPSKGLEWSLAIKDIADRERPIWWFKHNWNDCPEYSSNILQSSIEKLFTLSKRSFL